VAEEQHEHLGDNLVQLHYAGDYYRGQQLDLRCGGTNAVGSVTSNTATLMVTPLSSVNIITNGLPTGQVQAAYTFPLQATGGTPPYT